MNFFTDFSIRVSVLTIILNILTGISFAQTNISGIVNFYAKVTNIDATGMIISYTNATGCAGCSFTAGDKILVIQMKGASVNTSNTSSYGTITSYNDAGKFEFATIASVGSGTITITTALINSYTITGLVQVVRVKSVSGSAVVTGNIIPVAWNKSNGTGGIIVISVRDTLKINAGFTISANGSGFTGGAVSGISDGSAWCNWGDFVSTNITTDCYDGIYAQKGEGIADVSPNDYARGPQGNGGGGAGEHNAGGGGGGHISAGGDGGKQITNCGYRRNNTGTSCNTPSPGAIQSDVCTSNTSTTDVMSGGLGGNALAGGYAYSRIFMGGGGGGGQQNAAGGTNGGNGGGIVIITANKIINNSGITAPITANGNTPANTSGNEGAGGGGAGGSVLLEVGTFVNAITVEAKGGKGGNAVTTNTNCRGPGGGGGGGLVWVGGTSSATNFTADVSSGSAGIVICNSCGGTLVCESFINNCAVTPSAGRTDLGLVTSLPLIFESFNGIIFEQRIKLIWKTVQEKNLSYFEITKSRDGIHFERIGSIDAVGGFLKSEEYLFFDRNPWNKNYYRIKAVDYDGKFLFSTIVYLEVEVNNFTGLTIFPNPAHTMNSVHLVFTGKLPEEMSELFLFNSAGKIICNEKLMINATGDADIKIKEEMEPGIYYIVCIADDQIIRQRFVLEE